MSKWLDRRIAAPGPYLCLCLEEAEFEKAVKRLKVPNPGPWVRDRAGATAHTFQRDKGGTCVIVCLRDWRDRSEMEVNGILVHEAVHVWQQYCDDIGERSPGVEQEAYAIQAIAQELMTEFARRRVEAQKQ